MPVREVTPPSVEPLTLAEVKRHMRITPSEGWVVQNSYVMNDRVLGTDGQEYRCLLTHTSAAANRPVTGATYATNWELYVDDDDTYIQSLITVAREYAERTLCHRAFAVQTLEYSTNSFRPVFRLPRPPVIEVLTCTYKDQAGDTHSLLEGVDFYADTDVEPAVLIPRTNWPSGALYPVSPIRIQYQAGYPTPPEELKHFIRLQVAHWYENREAVQSDGKNATIMPIGVEYLLQGYRVFGAGDA